MSCQGRWHLPLLLALAVCAHLGHGGLGRPLQRDRRSIRRGRENDGAKRFLVDSRERRNSPACQAAPSVLGDRHFDEDLRHQRVCSALAQRAGCDGVGGRNVSHWRAHGRQIARISGGHHFTYVARHLHPWPNRHAGAPVFSVHRRGALLCAPRGGWYLGPPPMVSRILVFRVACQLHQRLARNSLSAGNRGVGGCVLQPTPRGYARIGYVARRFALRVNQSSLVHVH